MDGRIERAYLPSFLPPLIIKRSSLYIRVCQPASQLAMPSSTPRGEASNAAAAAFVRIPAEESSRRSNCSFSQPKGSQGLLPFPGSSCSKLRKERKTRTRGYPNLLIATAPTWKWRFLSFVARISNASICDENLEPPVKASAKVRLQWTPLNSVPWLTYSDLYSHFWLG